MNGSRPQAKVKSFEIPKSMVWEAFQRVKARSECALGDVEQLGQGQEDHWPSRSSASA